MTEQEKIEQELLEKIASRVASSRCEVCNDCGATISTDNPDTVALEILALIKQAGYFQEEAEWIGKLVEEGWIPPEEAKRYVKLAEDQTLPQNPYESLIGNEIPFQIVAWRDSRDSMLKAGWRKVEVKK